MNNGRGIAECVLVGSLIGFIALVWVQYHEVQKYKTIASNLASRPTPSPIVKREFINVPTTKQPCDGTGRMFNRDGQPCQPTPTPEVRYVPQPVTQPTISRPTSCFSNALGASVYTTCN